MICPSCHTANIEGADECANCGASLYGLDLPDAPQGSQSPPFVRQPIRNLPQSQPARAGISDPVSAAVRAMQTRNTDFVLVMDGEHLAGIITSWDVLQKVAGPTVDLLAVTCAEIMTPDPMCLREDDSIALALNLMASGDFRHVPIIEGAAVAHVLDFNDLFRQVSPNLV